MHNSFIYWLIAYLLLISVVAFLNKQNKIVDFYRSKSKPLKLFVLIFTFCSTLFSAFFVVGIPGFIHNHGIGTIYWVLIGDILGALGIYIVGKKFLEKLSHLGDDELKIVSPLEVISPNILFSIVFIVATTAFILPYLAIQISGVGKLLVSATNGEMPFLLGTALVMFVIYIYSFLAGIRGVAISDSIQGIILFSTVFILSGYIVYVIFDSPTDILQHFSNKEEYLKLPGPKGYFTSGTLLSYVFLFAFLPITQPQFLTRYLIVKSEIQLKKIAIGFGFILCISFIPIIFIGLGGLELYPNIKDSDFLLGKLLSDYFPPIFSGFVFIGVLSAAMSTADSILLSVGQMFSRDIFKNIFFRNLEEKKELTISKIFILIMAIIAFSISLSSSDLILYLSRASFAGTLQLAPAVLGNLFLSRLSKFAGTSSIITGIATMLLLRGTPSLPLGLDSSIYGLLLGITAYFITYQIEARRFRHTH